MRIAITGPHSQGKSTLCSDLILTQEFKRFSILGNITRGLKDAGISINELGSDWSQSLVINKHIEHYLRPGNNILDRCILDGLVYTTVLYDSRSVSYEVYEYARFMFEKIMCLGGGYELIFYVEPTLPVATDNVRSTNESFFNSVKMCFESTIKEYDLKLIRISGSRDERVEQVIKKYTGKSL